MITEFRPTSPEDSTAVAAFLRRIFSLDAASPLIETQHLYWKNWLERPDWPGSRGYVLVSDGTIMAHGTVIPLSFTSCETRLKMVFLIDWAADPGFAGAGVFLLKHIAQTADAMVVVGGNEMTRKLLPALGFVERGEVTQFVRPVRPLRRLAGQKLNLRTAAQFARSLLWTLRAPSTRTGGWTVRRIAEPLEAQSLVWPRPNGQTAIFERDAAKLAYLLECPATAMEVYVVAEGEKPRGYFVLAYAPGQTRVVDFYVDSERREDWRTLIQLATAQSRLNRAAAEVVSTGSDATTRQALLDCGFHARGDAPLRILPARGVTLPEGPIRIYMSDADAAYLHTGKNEYLA